VLVRFVYERRLAGESEKREILCRAELEVRIALQERVTGEKVRRRMVKVRKCGERLERAGEVWNVKLSFADENRTAYLLHCLEAAEHSCCVARQFSYVSQDRKLNVYTV